MQQNHLCFVWGPPLTGQRRWVARAMEETEADTATSLYFLEEFEDESELKSQLDRLDALIQSLPADQTQHVYCICPWIITEYGLELEDWIAGQKIFGDWQQDPELAPWGLSFVGLCPFNAEKLPLHYREALEEFSRSARSEIVVVTPEENQDPEWLGSEALDFGTHVEVFEEVLWSTEIDHSPKRWTFSERAEFSTVLVPLHLQESRFLPLVREALGGTYGKLWNAELAWRGGDGKVHFITTQNNRVYSWSSTHPGFRQLVPENCALFEICGDELKPTELARLQDPKSFN